MSIRYVCSKCNETFNLSGFMAVNEVGRKSCDNCGSNEDDLIVVGRNDYRDAILKETMGKTIEECLKKGVRHSGRY